MMLQTTVL